MSNELQAREPSGISALFGGKLPASVQVEAQRAMMEVLSQVQAARLMPRADVMDEVEAELMALAAKPEFADRAVYAKPVGKDDFVEGPSTWLAKQMASLYPNFQWQTVEHGIVDDQDQVECVTWDVERNNRSKAIVRVSHYRWNAYEKKAILEQNPSKIHDMVKSETSKTIRNLIFDNLPKLLIEKVYEACIVTNDKADAALLKDRKTMIEYFEKTLEVKREQILTFLKRKELKDVEQKDVRRLRALVQSFKQGDIKASDIWKEAKDIPVREAAPAAKEDAASEKKASSSRGATRSTSTKESASPPSDAPSEDTTSTSSGSSEEKSHSSASSEQETQSSSQDSEPSDKTPTDPKESTSSEPSKPKDAPTPDEQQKIKALFK